MCQCECGTKQLVCKYELKRGNSTQCRSCASRKKAITHGCATKGKINPVYNAWAQMKSRCYNHNDKKYNRYGQRGITVFDEWKNSFESFYEYIGDKPSKEFSLDRIDNNGNYEPGNVRWASPKIQANNRSNNIKKHISTTFQLNIVLHEKLKLMCTLTKKSMGEFIRLAIIDKIQSVKVKND